MKNKEAIGYLKFLKEDETMDAVFEGIFFKALDKGIQALKKQQPKKPTFEATKRKLETCPSCANVSIRHDGAMVPFCYLCGQAIDWSIDDGE